MGDHNAAPAGHAAVVRSVEVVDWDGQVVVAGAAGSGGEVVVDAVPGVAAVGTVDSADESVADHALACLERPEELAAGWDLDLERVGWSQRQLRTPDWHRHWQLSSGVLYLDLASS
jgi:hypothetical protein